MKKFISVLLASTLVISIATIGMFSASAYEAPGGFGTLGEYNPTNGVNTNHLMFAMPGVWQNGITRNERCGGAAGMYWWTGFDTPDNKAGGHGWPGYKAVKENEEGVDNLWGIDVPTYGNGETGNAYMLIWNNYLDCGRDKDTTNNPFYDAACQTVDIPCSYYSRWDRNETYEIVFRYIYLKSFITEEVNGINEIDINSENFWVDMNRLAAVHRGKNWDSLNEDEKTIQIDLLLDGLSVDLSEFGSYASNFFNEDLVGSYNCYPIEKACGFGESFTFDNMVYVVNLDPEEMYYSPVSGKTGYNGEWFFYYGGGEYGSWPTKVLNEQMNGVSGNFTDEEYLSSNRPTSPLDEVVSENGFTFIKNDDDTYCLSDYDGINTDIVIPKTIKGRIEAIEYNDSSSFNIIFEQIPVTGIDDWVFANNTKLESVVIPDSVTHIGKGTFYNCVELKTVTMGNNVTEIGANAFEKCLYLENITLSNQLETIGDEAFYDCRRLKRLDIPATVTTIGEEAFTNCRSLTSLTIPGGVTTLGSASDLGFGMFENCKNLKEITIPESVGYIQDNAFDGCGQVTIRAKANSYAAQYAASNQLAFSKIDSDPVGDANSDNEIDIRDVTTIQRHVAEFQTLTGEQFLAADTNGDGDVTIEDATHLQMYFAEFDVVLG